MKKLVKHAKKLAVASVQKNLNSTSCHIIYQPKLEKDFKKNAQKIINKNM